MIKGTIRTVDQSPLPLEHLSSHTHTQQTDLYFLWRGVVQKSQPFFIQRLSAKEIVIRFHAEVTLAEYTQFISELTQCLYEAHHDT
ncbi:MAG: hypothetical protein LR017_03415 [Candidatus Pacebacteria bacterium]|nr:hypothetical protein [Candidatus Paceibacterota bacterium]